MNSNEPSYDGEPRELPEPDLNEEKSIPSSLGKSILNEARFGEHGTLLDYDPRESDISGNAAVPDDTKISSIEQDEIERQKQILRDMGIDPDAG
jgi:hypothetical protein